MANPYKSIGNTAAAVVSILAIGTLCWWQRPVTPINGPRPQDEAEIMTAVLERHYAMGRQNVGYYNSVFNGAYTTNYTTNLVYASITFTGGPLGTNGYYYDVPPTGTYTVALSPGGVGVLNSGGGVYMTFDNPMLYTYPDYPVYWWDDAYPSGVVNPYSWATFAAEDPLIWGAYNYVVAMTNLVATNTTPIYDTQTNTISFFPNAPFRFASGIRAAFLAGETTDGFYGWVYGGDVNLQKWYVPGAGALAYTPHQSVDIGLVYDSCLVVNRYVGWIIPEDSYMLTGDTSWFGAVPHTNVFGGPLNYWRKWESVDDGEYGTSWSEFADKFFARSQFVWTNYVSKCDSTWRTTTNYATSYVTNRVIGGVTNTVTNTTFSTTNYVNTGSVNTYVSEVAGSYFGECVGMMFSFERDSPGITRVDANWMAGFDGEPAGKYHPAFWSTNTYRDMGRALSLLQWIREARIVCEDVTWTASYTSGVFEAMTVVSNTGVYVGRVVSDTNNPPRVTVSGTVAKYAFYNDRPFTVDNVYFVPDTISFANGITPATWGSNPPPISIVSPYASATADWWPLTSSDMQTWVNNAAAGIVCGVDPLPSMVASVPCVAFHVQFSALTNYLDHAPAR